MEASEAELKTKYKRYKDTPLSHPDYRKEWDVFWKRRYKELRAGNEIISEIK